MISKRGFSIIEVLIGIGIMSVVSMALTSLLTGQQREIRALNESLDAANLQSELLRVLADGKVCTVMLTAPTPKTFDSTNANSTIPLNAIPISPGSTVNAAQVGATAAPLSHNLIVTKIQIQDFQQDPANPNQYLANIGIGFNSPPALVRSIKDIKMPVLLTVTGGGTSNATITFCKAAGGNGKPNYLATWISPATLGASTIYQDPATGNVGLGTATPQLMLDVNGSIRPGFNGVSIGGGCSPEGAMGYDMGSHTPVYCSNTGRWAGMAGVGTQAPTVVAQGNGTATCPPGTALVGGTCDQTRGGDGRVVNTMTCVPQGNGIYCNNGNAGTCVAYAICR